jgi:hypothetical protein
MGPDRGPARGRSADDAVEGPPLLVLLEHPRRLRAGDAPPPLRSCGCGTGGRRACRGQGIPPSASGSRGTARTSGVEMARHTSSGGRSISMLSLNRGTAPASLRASQYSPRGTRHGRPAAGSREGWEAARGQLDAAPTLRVMASTSRRPLTRDEGRRRLREPRSLELPGPSRRIRVEPVRLPEPARRPREDPRRTTRRPPRIPEPRKPARERTPA